MPRPVVAAPVDVALADWHGAHDARNLGFGGARGDVADVDDGGELRRASRDLVAPVAPAGSAADRYMVAGGAALLLAGGLGYDEKCGVSGRFGDVVTRSRVEGEVKTAGVALSAFERRQLLNETLSVRRVSY